MGFVSSNKQLSKNNIYSSSKINLKHQSTQNNLINPNKSAINNLLNSNQTHNHNNILNSNNNIDYQNTSMSSSASIFLNKSIRPFNVQFNSNIKVNFGKNEQLLPLRVFSANKLNSNFTERKDYRSNIKLNDDSQYLNSKNIRTKSSNNCFNNTQKKLINKISNREREMMFKIKKLNEEISKMAQVNEDQSEHLTKRVDFKRGGNMKKGKSQYRATKLNQEENYNQITSNFKKKSLDKINAFYSDKFDPNDNLNLKLNSNCRDKYCEDLDNDTANLPISNEVVFKEQNPIRIIYNKFLFLFYIMP